MYTLNAFLWVKVFDVIKVETLKHEKKMILQKKERKKEIKIKKTNVNAAIWKQIPMLYLGWSLIFFKLSSGLSS